MVGEYQTCTDVDGRHVTSRAGPSRDRPRVRRGRVALLAGGVIGGQPALDGRMRRMTGEATQTALALSKASGGGERRRLMAHIPGIGKIDGLVGTEGHAMAGAAQSVEFLGGEFARIGGTNTRGIANMR